MAISPLPKFKAFTLGTGTCKVVCDKCDRKESLARGGSHRNDPVDLDRIIGMFSLAKSHINRSVFSFKLLFSFVSISRNMLQGAAPQWENLTSFGLGT